MSSGSYIYLFNILETVFSFLKGLYASWDMQ